MKDLASDLSIYRKNSISLHEGRNATSSYLQKTNKGDWLHPMLTILASSTSY